jgi:hypothetical protein
MVELERPEPVLRKGDIFLTRGRGFVSRAIRFFSRRVGERRTKVNHVGLVVVDGSFHDAIVVEARRKVLRHRLGEAYGGKTDEVAVYRPVRLSPDQIRRAVKAGEDYVGRSYGYGKIVLHALDWALQGAYVFRRLGRMDDYPICSWLVAHAYGKAGVNFGVPPGAATPDDIWDHLVAHPGDFVSVGDLTRIPLPLARPAA